MSTTNSLSDFIARPGVNAHQTLGGRMREAMEVNEPPYGFDELASTLGYPDRFWIDAIVVGEIIPDRTTRLAIAHVLGVSIEYIEGRAGA